MSKRPTIQDIAKHAGVSPATVSRVLNNFDYVSEEKRQVVLEAMAELDYRPSFTARHMRTQRSQIIGLLTDEVTTTPYAVDIVRGAQDAAWQHNKILMLMNSGPNLSTAQTAVEIMLERAAEGIIYAAMWHHAVTVPKNIHEVPVVLANCFVEDDSMPSFVPDEVMGGYVATKKLIEAGYERVAIINLESDIPAHVGRLQGYKMALQEANIPINPQYIVYDVNTSRAGHRLASHLLQLDVRPNGIFAGTDRIAVGVYDALKESNLWIAEDVGVTSFDNMELITESLRPSLSSVQLPHYEMGYQSVEYLIEGKQDVKRHLVPCELVERNST